ncbi:MAG TPA: sigma-70 family RNA polymerase sigma factor [Cyclobacteriaceae bacterium]|nr:sigma-70 family RNA polymerase sigma factor [Cyclobacteriaceae bacterium]
MQQVKYQQVISGFQATNNEGLKVLFEGYGQQLFGFSVTHFHIDEDEGYEVLYKTMETVGKVITRYDFSSESHFANWLFKIHKNNVLQLLRRKRSKEQEFQVVDLNDWEKEAKELEEYEFKLEFFKPVVEQISSINPYDNTSKTNKLFLAMQKGLQQLSEVERELLLLRMNNYSYDEIAAMLNIENNQLKVKFLRAKAKLEKKTLELLNNTPNETK